MPLFRTCRYQTNSVACHIQKLAVHPESRNQGIAGSLLLVCGVGFICSKVLLLTPPRRFDVKRNRQDMDCLPGVGSPTTAHAAMSGLEGSQQSKPFSFCLGRGQELVDERQM